jgi:hypothetical protein
MAWLSYKDDLADPFYKRMAQISSDRKQIVGRIKGLIGEEEWQKHYDAVTPEEMEEIRRESEKKLPPTYTPAATSIHLSAKDELKATVSALLEGTIRRLVTIVLYVVFFYFGFKVLMFLIKLLINA